MKRIIYVILTLLICGLPAQSWAQGQGKGHGRDERGKPAHAQGGQKQKSQPSKQKVQRAVAPRQTRETVRTINRSQSGMSARERAALAAVTNAGRRGIRSDEFVVAPIGERVHVKNKRGVVLVDLDERRARDIAFWNVVPVRSEVSKNAPSFCSSGAGHPVWGRQWCIDKGFGLGRYNNVRWARATNFNNVAFVPRYYTTGSLLGDVLLKTIGPLAYDRLALHAISLGYTEPLRGAWAAEPAGPRVLRLYSGTYPVAEIVDTNRDNRADFMVVAYY